MINGIYSRGASMVQYLQINMIHHISKQRKKMMLKVTNHHGNANQKP